MQSQTTLRQHLSPTRWQNSEHLLTHNACDPVGKWAPPPPPPPPEAILTLDTKMTNTQTFWPRNSTSGILSYRYAGRWAKESKFRVLKYSMFAMTKDWKQPKCPQAGDQFNQFRHNFIQWKRMQPQQRRRPVDLYARTCTESSSQSRLNLKK